MDITKSREDFEIACRNGLINYGLAKFENGEYASESTRSMFMAFKAGRESIEVEIPYASSAFDYNVDVNVLEVTEVIELLRTAGIRIKGESE
ncbi:hypothetical protein [Yersinia mollaretii]|uniref:hypothetical protein n=1 Tax=Yersinia mollaretii TaxID=33060 RepID=UPI00119E6634|nr:hypothetical protein [Yersinia mollaretii]